MQFDYPHDLSVDEAHDRLKVLGTYLTNRHGIDVRWEGKQGKVDGKYLMVKIEGTLIIEDSQVRFDGRDPGMLWRKKAINYLKEKLELYLDQNTPIGELPTTKT